MSTASAINAASVSSDVTSLYRQTVMTNIQIPQRLNPTDTLERMHVIAEYGILDTLPEAAFDNLAQLASEICSTDMAAVSLVCDDRQWFKATVGFSARETPIEQSFCAYVLDQPASMIVPDAASDPTFCTNELVTGPFNLRFYAGVPIRSHNGVPIGALCVLDTQARPRGLSETQIHSLSVLARQVEAQLELRRTGKLQEKRIEREIRLVRELETIADHDSLTGLANRQGFRRKFERALASRRRDQHCPALLIADIDNFKAINDANGHTVGDQVLAEVARRLKRALGSKILAGRISGDEFAIMVPDCASQARAAEIANLMLDAVALPLLCDGRVIHCTVSIGYALATPQDGEFAHVFTKADLALANAKASGRGSARGYSTRLASVHDNAREMIERARAALADGRVVPHYQPKVNLQTGELAGFEALLRIAMPDGSFELPASVAAAFEDRDLAIALTDRMLGTVLTDLGQAMANGLDLGHVAINTTTFDFSMRNFAGQLLSKIAAAGIPNRMIEVEVTESVAMGKGSDCVRYALSELAKSGVGISLDDFGTGYASLTNVKQLPISALKIDRSFVAGLGSGIDDSIILAMATLSRHLGLALVAEGVETEQQIAILRDFGIPLGQGLFLSAPVPKAQFATLADIAASGRWAAPARAQGKPDRPFRVISQT